MPSSKPTMLVENVDGVARGYMTMVKNSVWISHSVYVTNFASFGNNNYLALRCLRNSL